MGQRVTAPFYPRLAKAPALAPFPAWLEDARVQERDFGQAYELAGPSIRALLKTAMATAADMFSSPENFCQTQVNSGQWRSVRERPCVWAAVLFPPEYDAAARICAAALAPLLAGVRTVFAACVGGCPRPEALTGLEMCAVEDVFAISQESCMQLLQDWGSKTAGALLCLHGTPVDLASIPRGIQVYAETRLPIIVADAGFDSETLFFLHGAAAFAQYDGGFADAVISEEIDQDPCDCRLVLTRGLEGLWIFPNLSPDFFKFRTQFFGLLSEEY